MARRLATQVPSLFGCDVADPVSAIEEMDFVHADTRQSVIGKLVRQLHIDTVVHMAVTVDSAAENRSAHETNVIGTMNVLAGCAGPSSPVRRLVVKSSQAVYGAGPGDPSFVTEQSVGADRPAYGLKRDLLEMEQLAQIGRPTASSATCSRWSSWRRSFRSGPPVATSACSASATGSAQARSSAPTCRSLWSPRSWDSILACSSCMKTMPLRRSCGPR